MKGKSIYTWIISILMVLCCAAAVTAVGPAKTVKAEEQKGSLTVHLPEKNKAEGVPFNLSKVADKDASGKFVLTSDFAKYKIEVNGLDNEQMRTASTALADYAMRDSLKPYKTASSDSQGTCAFTDLEPGAYMVFSPESMESQESYTPVFAYIPAGAVDGEPVYDFEVDAKPWDSVKTTSCEVYKIWDDNDDEEVERPEEIEVQLLTQKDGKVYDTVTLSEENGWHYIWEDLPEDDYTVIEKEVPEGYELSITREGTKWYIKNTYNETTTETETTTTTEGTVTTTSGKKIPQTGQLWWPVPVLLCAGFLCLIVGMMRRSKGRRK